MMEKSYQKQIFRERKETEQRAQTLMTAARLAIFQNAIAY